jgi:ankyrin repeat protein
MGLAALTTVPLSAFAQGGPPGDPLGPDLMIAIRKNDNKKIKELLSKGAQLENRNWLGLSPLMVAAMFGNEEIVRTLLDSKADIEGASHFGTALTFAGHSDNPKVTRLLLDRGAKIETGRADGITPLMMAAGKNHMDAVQWLLEKKADVNAADTDGATALMYAARAGHTQAADALLKAGAKVDAADSHGRTALMYAAMNGHPAMVSTLVKAGAGADLKDKKGFTAHGLAARYAPENATFKALKVAASSGARQASSGGEATFVSNPPSSVVRRPASTREAVEKAIALMEKSADNFSKNAGCVSCHHQGLGLMATGMAKELGYRYDRGIAELELGRMRKEDDSHANELKAVLPHPEMYKFVPAVDIAEFVPGVSFMYSAFVAHDYPATEAIRGAAVILASQQEEDGRWGFVMRREPIQWSEFTTTALSIKVLKTYFPKDRAKELDERIARARRWLIATQPKTNEDRTFRLLALKWAGAPQEDIARAMAEVKKLQRKDGGWAQFPTSRSDAYATGTSLYALRMAGMPAKDSAYKRGAEYLLRTQDEDGSWYVNKRGIQANTYFDAGFPHGQSQYISFGATAWASMALMLGAEAAQQTASAK